MTKPYVMHMLLKCCFLLRVRQEAFRPIPIGGNDQMTEQHGLILPEQQRPEAHILLLYLEEMHGSDAGFLMHQICRNIQILRPSPSVLV